MTDLSVNHLSVRYQEMPVLHDVSVTFPKGTMTAIVGPNGAGKSTLIKSMMGLLPIQSGTIGGVSGYQPHQIAYVPQSSHINWHFPITAFDVALMGRYGHMGWLKRPSKKDKAIAKQALETMGMSAFAERQINALSGGQKQRVFLSRALAQEAQVYLLDEPLQGVDKQSEAVIIHTLQTICANDGIVVAVHHDLSTVPQYFDRVVLLNREVIASGATSEVFTAAHLALVYSKESSDVVTV